MSTPALDEETRLDALAQGYTPAELAAWDLGLGEVDRRFRRSKLVGVPEEFVPPILHEYREKYDQDCLRTANLYLWDVQDSLTGEAVRLASSDDDLVSWAARRGSACRHSAQMHGWTAETLERLSARSRVLGVIPPEPSRDTTVRGAIARLCDELWWRRALRRRHARLIESEAIGLGLVHRRAGLYLSDGTLSVWRQLTWPVDDNYLGRFRG